MYLIIPPIVMAYLMLHEGVFVQSTLIIPSHRTKCTAAAY